MSIPFQTPYNEHTGNGVATVYAYEFTILQGVDLVVRINGSILVGGYSISGIGDRDGGSVTFNVAPASGADILLSRQVALKRDTDYQENGDLRAETLDDDLDRVWMALQDQGAIFARSIRAPIGETLNDLPPAASRASRLLGFDNLGRPALVTTTENGGAALAIDLLNGGDPTKGAGMVGFNSAVTYPVGSVGHALQQVDFSWLTNKPTTLPGYGITDAASALDLRSVRDQLTSLNASTIAYGDNASFTELWQNLTAWVLAVAPGLQVSGSKAYSTNQGAGSGANHSYSIGASGRFREIAQVIYPATAGSSGGIIVGISTDAAGGLPTSGAAMAYGLYSRVDNVVLSWAAGASAAPSGSGSAAAGAHTITVAGDENFVSAVLRKNDGATESRARWARASINVQNLYCFNSDTRQLTGMAIGGLGAKQAQATVAPRAGIEDQGASVMWSGVGDVSFRVALPASYDSRIPSPLAICFHGNGSDENHFADNANGKVVTNALLAAGYIVLSCSYSPNTSTWGAQNGLNAYVTAYNYVKSRFAIGSVVFYANSMGSIESLLTLADNRIPGIVAWCGTSPTFSLQNNYNHINGGYEFRATINAAYGITGVAPNDYTTLTAGHDPALMIGYSFRRIPMKVIVATDDVDVPKSENSDLLQASISPYAPVTVTTTTGGHSFDFTPFAASIVSFFDGYSK